MMTAGQNARCYTKLMKILIIKRDKIGDLLLTTPMLRQLRNALPTADIHVLANDYNAWVVENNTDIDHLWVYPRARLGKRLRFAAALHQAGQIFQLRRERFDVVIAANGEESPRAIRRALHAKGTRCIAYCTNARLAKQLTDPLPPPVREHEIERLLGLLMPLGITRENSIYPHYILPDSAQACATAWLVQQGIVAGGYVVLGLGARIANRQPTVPQILRWSAYFKANYGLDTVFTWTPGAGGDNPLYPGDDALAQSVLEVGLPYVHPLRGSLSFKESVVKTLGVVWGARFSIFPDSGLMHFAAASPGGVIGLLSDDNLSPQGNQWQPRGPRAGVIEAPHGVPALSDEQLFESINLLLPVRHFDAGG